VARETRAASFNWRLWLRAALWTFLLATTVIAARAVSRLALTDPHFVLDRDAGVAANSQSFTILGLSHASRARVTRVFQEDFGKNIFQIPIDEPERQEAIEEGPGMLPRYGQHARLFPQRIGRCHGCHDIVRDMYMRSQPFRRAPGWNPFAERRNHRFVPHDTITDSLDGTLYCDGMFMEVDREIWP